MIPDFPEHPPETPALDQMERAEIVRRIGTLERAVASLQETIGVLREVQRRFDRADAQYEMEIERRLGRLEERSSFPMYHSA